MLNPEIEEFAKILVQQVRDRAIRNCDTRLHEDAKDIVAARWKKLITDESSAAVIKALIPDVVDATLAQVLWAIDQELLRLIFIASNEKNADLPVVGSGQLEGWYMGHEGWRHKYSRERFIDDFKGPKL
jgi:hypothetical protein